MPGMILSNEPGYCIPRKYGIRIENLMYVERQENGFLSFKQLTSIIPYDRRLMDVQMLAQDEIKWINSYHQFVYKNLENSVKDKEWLVDEEGSMHFFMSERAAFSLFNKVLMWLQWAFCIVFNLRTMYNLEYVF